MKIHLARTVTRVGEMPSSLALATLAAATAAAALRITPAGWSARPGRTIACQMATPTGMAVLFDCDGVLADTERDGHRVVSDALGCTEHN